MKNVIRTLIITALFCAPQMGYSMQPDVTQKPSFVKTALQYAGKGLRFGVKGADRIAGYGLMGLSIINNVKQIKWKNNMNISDFSANLEGINEAPDNLLELKDGLCKKMGIDGSAVYIDSRTGGKNVQSNLIANASASYIGNGYIIGVNKRFLNLPIGQQEAVLAHELTHIKHNDPYHRLIVEIMAIAGTAGSGYVGAQLYKKTYNRYAQSTGKLSCFASRLKTKTIPGLLSSAVLQWVISQSLTSKYARYMEKRADLESAVITGKAQDLIDWINCAEDTLNQNIHDMDKICEQDYLSGKSKQREIVVRMPDRDHPSHDQRIAYLKPYTQPQSVAPEREYNDLAISC